VKTIRALLLSAAALAVPACGGNISVPAPLLDEQFNGGFPGSNWTTPATSGPGTTVQIVGARLAFTTANPSISATTTTLMSFTNPNLTMDFQVAIKALAPADQGAATVDILNSTPAVVASMVWDSPTQMVTFKILGTTVASIAAPLNDGSLSGFRFAVDSMGQAAWFFSNVQQGTSAALPGGPLTLRIGAAFGTGTQWPEIDFDNITVARP
jgi:hypothetical protein